jgi:hypothetical protein
VGSSRGGPLMRLLALLTPCVVLALLWALARLEAWMKDASAPHGRRPSWAARQAPQPDRRRLEGAHHG